MLRHDGGSDQASASAQGSVGRKTLMTCPCLALPTPRRLHVWLYKAAGELHASRHFAEVTRTEMPEEVRAPQKTDESQQSKQDDTGGERRPVETPVASPTTSIQARGVCAELYLASACHGLVDPCPPTGPRLLNFPSAGSSWGRSCSKAGGNGRCDHCRAPIPAWICRSRRRRALRRPSPILTPSPKVAVMSRPRQAMRPCYKVVGRLLRLPRSSARPERRR